MAAALWVDKIGWLATLGWSNKISRLGVENRHGWGGYSHFDKGIVRTTLDKVICSHLLSM